MIKIRKREDMTLFFKMHMWVLGYYFGTFSYKYDYEIDFNSNKKLIL